MIFERPAPQAGFNQTSTLSLPNKSSKKHFNVQKPTSLHASSF
jgi:hypothetical protein